MNALDLRDALKTVRLFNADVFDEVFADLVRVNDEHSDKGRTVPADHSDPVHQRRLGHTLDGLAAVRARGRIGWPETEAHGLWDVYADPDVARYVGGDSLTADSAREQAMWFAQVWADRGYGQSAVICRETGQMIGRIGLSFWPEWDEIELGYVLAAKLRAKEWHRRAPRPGSRGPTQTLPSTI